MSCCAVFAPTPCHFVTSALLLDDEAGSSVCVYLMALFFKATGVLVAAGTGN